MNTIYEAKSNRVKGISFHPNFPWILTSLHNGEILLYDYIHGVLLEKFVEHEGPVRSVHFHNIQPFFVSGGDDCKIKVWNYNLKKCQFNLLGHSDYIRTVQFHHEVPWILSASDDQTIRVWNWLNRTLLSTATGHDHYVMSAFFHPSQDLIVSASLDNTIRIWDYSVLRKKFYEARSNTLEVIAMDITVKHKLEGHDRGVNWAVFHPKLNLIASGSDDKNIKIWKYSETTWSDADTLRGHINNVSSVVFHRNFDYLLSNSEDKSIRLWDLGKKSVVDKLTRESERFWVLAVHPTLNIFASGSDSGMIVFRLEDTRIPAMPFMNQIFFYQSKAVRCWRLGETDNKVLIETRCQSKGLRHDVKSVLINPFINQPQQLLSFAITVDDNTNKRVGYYYLKYEASANKYTGSEQIIDTANSVAFLSNNKLVCMTTTGNLMAYDTNNLNNRYPIDTGVLKKEQFHMIFQGPLGRFIVKFKNGIVGLFDVNTKKVIQDTTELTDLKFVVWNQSLSVGALVGTNSIFIINKSMDILNKIKENSKITSACYDENGVLFYTTYFHLKYTLQEPGLNGIVKSTESPIYLMSVHNGTFHYSDSLQELKSANFNYTDVRFKLNLLNKNYDDIVNILRSGAVYGLKAIENIQNAGFPDLSLKFVNDPKQKFYLAMKSGKLEEASSAAEILKDKFYYDKLAEKAMMMGKLDIAEISYVKSQNLDKLIFFYVMTGRQDKLLKVQKALQHTGDNSRRFLNSIFTGNVDERITILTETGHSSLALLTAKIHQKDDFETSIIETSKTAGKEIKLNEEDIKLIKSRAAPIVPLKPLISVKNKEYHSNWTTLTEIKRSSQQTTIDNILSQKEEDDAVHFDSSQSTPIFNQIVKDDKSATQPEKSVQVKINTDKWKDEEEDDEEIQHMLEEASKNAKLSIGTLTQPDRDLLFKLHSNSTLPGIQAALGNIKLSLNYLRSQIGITGNYEVLKPIMRNIYMSCYSQVKFVPYLAPNDFLLRSPTKDSHGNILPQTGISQGKLALMLNTAYQMITDAEMTEALKMFRDIIKYSIFYVATDIDEEKKVKEIVYTCCEYIYLTRLSLLGDTLKDKDKVRYTELSCMMSLCKLESAVHKFLIYKKAKGCCKNIKNFITGVAFLKKILALEKELLSTFPKDFEKAREEFDNFQKLGTNQHTLGNFNVNENLPCIRSYYCSKKFIRLDTSQKCLKCPLCQSVCSMEFKGTVCETCNLCTLGEEVIGFKLIESYD